MLDDNQTPTVFVVVFYQIRKDWATSPKGQKLDNVLESICQHNLQRSQPDEVASLLGFSCQLCHQTKITNRKYVQVNTWILPTAGWSAFLYTKGHIFCWFLSLFLALPFSLRLQRMYEVLNIASFPMVSLLWTADGRRSSWHIHVAVGLDDSCLQGCKTSEWFIPMFFIPTVCLNAPADAVVFTNSKMELKNWIYFEIVAWNIRSFG